MIRIKQKYFSKLILFTFVLFSTFTTNAQTPSQVIPLYQGVAPGSEQWTQKEGLIEIENTTLNKPYTDTLVWNVVKPTLSVFKPKPGTGNGTAVIVAPGGGFRVLSYKNEGLDVAQWLTDRGFTAFVLKYRLHRMPDDPAEIRKTVEAMMAATSSNNSGANSRPRLPRMELGEVELAGIRDGQESIKLVRSRAKEFGIDPNKIGIIGFSAGGAVSGGATVRAEINDRPNFVGVIYSFVLGELPADLPPAFFAAAADDPLATRMPELFSNWLATGASAELHVYAEGRHGFGAAKQNLPVDNWLESFYAWIGQQGFVQ
ncbi:alpha/beta hydrolase [Aurantivibrio infirmus]